MSGREIVGAPNRAWLKLLWPVTLFIARARDEGPVETEGWQYPRENKAIFHPWKFLMSEISRLPLDTGETWRCAKITVLKYTISKFSILMNLSLDNLLKIVNHEAILMYKERKRYTRDPFDLLLLKLDV